MNCETTESIESGSLRIAPTDTITANNIARLYEIAADSVRKSNVNKVIFDYTASRIDLPVSRYIDSHRDLGGLARQGVLFIALIRSDNGIIRRHVRLQKTLHDIAYINDRIPVVCSVFDRLDDAEEWIKDPVVTI
ncbi:MAG: hypothetical protein ACOC2H_06085 [Spirochaetota bacterium]